MPKPTAQATTAEVLRAYGYDTEDGDALVRVKLGREKDKWVPTDGGWFYYQRIDGEWVQRFYKVDASNVGGVQVMQPDFVWPNDEVARIYTHAVEQRAAGYPG